MKQTLLMSAAATALLIATPSFAQDAPATAKTPAPGEESVVVVTGSRIARTGFNASTPVAVVGELDIQRSGSANVERTLQQLGQVVASGIGSQYGNQVDGQRGGHADVNLRGFGSNRNLVLVNGRRYAIFDAQQITDINTIPASLISRAEVVTGGSSAVYGSDAITGVVNFIMKDDFEGVEARGLYNWVGATDAPSYDLNLTVGGNFDEGRGNMVVAFNYLQREPILREAYDWSYYGMSDGCIVPGSGTPTSPGTRLTPASGQTCVQAGGMMGLIYSGSSDIPNGRFFGIPAYGGSNAGLNAAYAAAGLSGMGTLGFTFDDAGNAARPYISPDDSYNNTPSNLLRQPQKRYMLNSFAHYDFNDRVTGYMELHYSHNEVSAQIAPANYNNPTLFNVNNPYLSAPLREVLRQLDIAETGTTTVNHGGTLFTTTPNDGLAVITAGRRYSDLAPRVGINNRNMFRGAWGVRGALGDVSESFLRDLKYDAYYTYAHTDESLVLLNGVSKSRLQRNLLSVGTTAPVCNIFGQNVTAACSSAIATNAQNSNAATMQVAQASVTGVLATAPAGDVGFSLGVEWRKTQAEYNPDANLKSGDVAGFSPGLPTKGEVTVKEVFGEFRIPLLSDLPLIDKLVLNTGFRQSDYSLKGIGSVSTYFYGTDWKINRDFAVRAQYQRAIRAPNVQELFGGLTQNSVSLNDPCSSRAPTSLQTAEVRALCVATGVPSAAVFTAAVQPQAFVWVQTGGNPDLSAETSDTYTAGVVFTPSFLPRLFTSIDYFDIDLEGAIAPLGGGAPNTFNLCYYTIKDANSDYCKAIPRNSITGEISEANPVKVLNANTGALRTKGVDLAARYRIDAAFGLPKLADSSTFDLSANFTYLMEYTQVPVSDIPTIENECVGALGGTCGAPLPRVRGSMRATWNVGDLSISLRDRYIGPVTTDRYLVPLRQASTSTPALEALPYPHVDAQNYIDLSFDYDLTPKVKVYGGANNLLNAEMPTTANASSYDPLGTEFFLGLNVKY